MTNHPDIFDIAPDGLGAAPSAQRRQRPSAEPLQGQEAPKARKKPTQRPEQPRKPRQHAPTLAPWLTFLTGRKFRLGLGIVLAMLTVVMLIVSINFLKSGAADQSIVEGRTPAEIQMSGAEVSNAGGPVGAWLAHHLFIEGLGIGSFVIVFYTGVLALSLLGARRLHFWAFTFKCLFTAISLSIVFGLFLYDAETAFHWGGVHGRYINQWMMSMTGMLGTYALSITLISLLTVIYFTDLRAIYMSVTGRVSKARNEMAEAAARARQTPKEPVDLPEAEAPAPAPRPAAPTPVPEPAAPPAQPAPPTAGIEFTIDDDVEPSQPSQPASKPAKPVSGEPEFTINTVGLGENDGPLPELVAPFSIRDELSHYTFPTVDLLTERPTEPVFSAEEQEENKTLITKTLQDYGIAIARIEATIGPTVTLYEIVPAEGVRIAQIRRLEDDIARSLEALGIRIIAPIRGKGTVGIEVPNRRPQIVSMHTVVNSTEFRECRMELPMAIGATISNKIFIADLAKMPHLLVAGATGQGKSVGLNCIIASLLYKKHPGELKFVLIDPKMVEFSLYQRIERHFLAKLYDEEEAVVTQPSKALSTLSALCVEMDNRYELLKKAGVRNIVEYNDKFTRRVLNPEKGHRFMPYIVIIVDEFADLIMVAGKDVSLHIARIAQKARAVGMHMIIATQRPSTDIITGMIKANFPARIAFRVAQMVDSKTILDCPGANRLIGRGDMLFSHNSMMERVQCAFIDTPEVEALADFIGQQTAYSEAYILPEPENSGDGALAPGAVDLSKRDEHFDECARFVVQNTTASTSSLQRRFGIGYNKAGKIMDQLEAAGIVGPADGQRPRSVLVDSVALEALLRSL